MDDAEKYDRVTELIRLAAGGDRDALEEVMSLLYGELRALAHARRARWRGDHTVSTTVLVHEAYLRLVGHQNPDWESRAHLLAVASRAMRQILIDYSRRRGAEKRGGGWDRVTLDRVDDLFPGLTDSPAHRAEALIELDVCLQRLEAEEPRYCRIVECRFFGGMTIDETSDALQISAASVKRGWTTARAWLHRELNPT